MQGSFSGTHRDILIFIQLHRLQGLKILLSGDDCRRRSGRGRNCDEGGVHKDAGEEKVIPPAHSALMLYDSIFDYSINS